MGNDQKIEGLLVHELKQIADSRGRVMHMIRNDNPIFDQFGEVYFSEVLPGVVKAWKCHKKQTQIFAVPVGGIELAIYDDRPDSKTRGTLVTLNLGRDNYQLVKIPPMLWYGFKCRTESAALIVNCADLPHQPGEAQLLASNDRSIPHQW
jgi:dTDP-4-dehydrorhamnose 3,5-epimerase